MSYAARALAASVDLSVSSGPARPQCGAARPGLAPPPKLVAAPAPGSPPKTPPPLPKRPSARLAIAAVAAASEPDIDVRPPFHWDLLPAARPAYGRAVAVLRAAQRDGARAFASVVSMLSRYPRVWAIALTMQFKYARARPAIRRVRSHYGTIVATVAVSAVVTFGFVFLLLSVFGG